MLETQTNLKITGRQGEILSGVSSKPLSAGSVLRKFSMKKIKLTQGQVVLVDNDDYEQLNKWKWCANRLPNNNQYRAVRGCSCWISNNDHAIYMHRQVMSCTQGLTVDHINHNQLDNQKRNLRICTNMNNSRNMAIRKGPKSSRYKGVGWDKINEKWRAKIELNYRHIHIGRYETEKDAAKAYDAKAIELFGDFACLNFPMPPESDSFEQEVMFV